jgi:hypothetical protein
MVLRICIDAVGRPVDARHIGWACPPQFSRLACLLAVVWLKSEKPSWLPPINPGLLSDQKAMIPRVGWVIHNLSNTQRDPQISTVKTNNKKHGIITEQIMNLLTRKARSTRQTTLPSIDPRHHRHSPIQT